MGLSTGNGAIIRPLRPRQKNFTPGGGLHNAHFDRADAVTILGADFRIIFLSPSASNATWLGYLPLFNVYTCMLCQLRQLKFRLIFLESALRLCDEFVSTSYVTLLQRALH